MHLSVRGGKLSCLSVGGGLTALPWPHRLTDLALIWARWEVPSPPSCLWQVLPALPSSSPTQDPTARLLPLPSARLTHTPTPAGSEVSHGLPLHSLAALTSPWLPPCTAGPARPHSASELWTPAWLCSPGMASQGLSGGLGCCPRGGCDPDLGLLTWGALSPRLHKDGTYINPTCAFSEAASGSLRGLSSWAVGGRHCPALQSVDSGGPCLLAAAQRAACTPLGPPPCRLLPGRPLY